MTAPLLPQHDPQPEDRARARHAQGAPYRYAYDQFADIACAPEVPRQDLPELGWGVKLAETLISVIANAAAVDEDIDRANPNHPEHIQLSKILQDLEKQGAKRAFVELQSYIQGDENDDFRPTAIDDYRRLFHTLPCPAIADAWTDDLVFARMRVAGPNPMALRRATALPEDFSLDEAGFGRAMATHAARGVATGVDSLAAAFAEGRVFVADWSGLAGVEGGTFPGPKKYLYAPTALFATTAQDRTLVPLAIRAEPGRSTVFLPDGGVPWQMAKVACAVADGNVHQAVSHLAHTHLVTGPFHLSARRNLAPSHPIGRLLAPHHEGTLYINDAANTTLMAPRGGVEAVMAGSIEFSRAAAIGGVQAWRLAEASPLVDLRARGVDDPSTLPDFPYRDDAILLWHAIHDWVESYVRIYYHTSRDVTDDPELQAFLREAAAPDGGRIGGIPPVRTISDLVEVLTVLIFTPSAQHAAVNFPQLELMSWVPNVPLAGYAPPPRGGEGPADLLAMLPPLGLAQYQAMLGHLLGSIHHTRLGHYSVGLFGHFAGDPRTDRPLQSFHERLADAERLIHERNRQRRPYPYLLPSRVPQSIDI